MIEFINIYNNIINTTPDKVAFTDGTESLTYKELDEASAKIYAYLKKQVIGKEDFVQLVLERGVKIPAAVMGVVKAGAAFMVLEDTYPSDRIDFIYKDCGCKLKIDNNLYDEIIATSTPLMGAEDMKPHDACYAVYTSGSTGTPKGVLHEYGNIEQDYKSFPTWYDNDIDNAAIFAPFYFVAGIIDIFHYITRGRTTYIVPHDMTRDFVAVKKFITDNNIQEIFLPPSYLKIYTNPAECLKVIYTGSEAANGLSYNGAPTLINFYAMSESGFVVLQANLDSPQDIAPVGVPLLDEIEVRLIDDDGNVIEGAGQGELCFINEYVRGYINLDKQTKEAWRDGLYHTGDLVRRDDDGNYFVVGRLDDMIKINGNRVEPQEIESRIKGLTGLTQVVAKGFKVNNRTFICAYYLEDEVTKLPNNLTAALKTQLPDYMIPTYYIPLKAFPLLPSGKIAKKNLMPPELDDVKREYVKPTNELEEQICNIYAETLKLDKVGITDDFFLIGGDSMSSIVVAAKFSEAGLNIDTKTIYNNRTPKELAGYYEANKDKLAKTNKPYDNTNALEVPNKSGKIFVKQTKRGEGGIFKYHMTFPIDVGALTKAYNNVIKTYPFYALTYEERDDDVFYKELGYVPKVKPLEEIDRTDHTGKPLIEIYYEEYELVICYYHVLTDGEGFFFFARTLLHEYINISKGINEEPIVRDFDYTHDVMSDKLDTSGDYVMYDLPDTYTMPEYDEDAKSLKTYKVSISKNNWNSIVEQFINEYDLAGIRKLQGIGGEDAFVAGYMLLNAIAEVHPDAERPLLCRFPINMRSALGRENTLRNCAMPQAFYNVTAGELLDDKQAMTRAYERINAQTSYENVAHEVNRLIEFRNNPDLDINEDPVYNYIRTANVLATNLGNITDKRDAEFVDNFSINFRPSCLTSIQVCAKGDREVLIINQVFDDDVYVKRFTEDLSCDGLYEVEVEEVCSD